MVKNKFKIYDNQTGNYKYDGQWLKPKEAVDLLADYHSIDWHDEEYDTIYDLLAKEETDEDKLYVLCEHGDYDLHEVIFVDENDNQVGGEYNRPDKIKEYLANNPTHTAISQCYL